MKTPKILTACFIFLVGSILLAGFSSKGWAESSNLIAKMDPATKREPMKQPPDGTGGGSGCMDQYRSFYNTLKTETSQSVAVYPLTPMSPACENCLRNQYEFGRAWSWASGICKPNCCP